MMVGELLTVIMPQMSEFIAIVVRINFFFSLALIIPSCNIPEGMTRRHSTTSTTVKLVKKSSVSANSRYTSWAIYGIHLL